MIVIADKFLNKYRIPSARASWWNYADAGLYFITICTVRHEHMFGKIKNQEMCLSPIGDIVQQEWDNSFKMRQELFCDTFVIIPNHIHAILRIENGLNTIPVNETLPPNGTVSADGMVETHGHTSLRLHNQSTDPSSHQPPSQNKKYGIAIRPPKSVSSFVAGFKSIATKRINNFRNNPKKPLWQARFHDHIIRNETKYQNIYNYIKNNPANWESGQSLK